MKVSFAWKLFNEQVYENLAISYIITFCTVVRKAPWRRSESHYDMKEAHYLPPTADPLENIKTLLCDLTENVVSDILLDDGYDGNLRKEGRSVRIVVTISSGPNTTKVSGRSCLVICIYLKSHTH